MPFATEEAWSWFNDGSVHVAAWPTAAELAGSSWSDRAAVLGVVGQALTGIRGAKTDAKASQKALVDSAVIARPGRRRSRLSRLAADDLRSVGRIADLRFESGDELTVTDILLAQALSEEER